MDAVGKEQGSEYIPAPGIEDIVNKGESIFFIGDAGGILDYFCVGVLLGYFCGQWVWSCRAGACFKGEKGVAPVVL